MKPLEGLDFIREKVRVRDNHTCQNCLKKWEPGMRRFDIHHLETEMESVKSYNYDKDNQDKLITLCHKCHLTLPHNVEKMKKAGVESLVKRGYNVFMVTTVEELVSYYKKLST
jgi:5-methylcytosine-specific restriction endonuclease McrA